MARERYDWHTGSLAWVLHRITGVLLSSYLIVHVWVVRTVSHGPEGFNRVMAAVQTPLFILFEVGLLGTVLYHSLNGIRLLLIDAGWGARRHKALFLLLMCAGLILLIAGGMPILGLLRRSFPQ